jgi:RimJ/RimL family protein N-acetyltransferase
MTTIRRLNVGEAELYRMGRLESLLESPEAFCSRYEEAIARSDQSWNEQADSSASGSDRATFLILEDRPVGLAALYRDSNDPNVGELIQMWVAPEKRGGSAASALINEIFMWAGTNGFSRVKAEVISSNTRAIRFYQNYGFKDSADEPVHSNASITLTKTIYPCCGGKG